MSNSKIGHFAAKGAAVFGLGVASFAMQANAAVPGHIDLLVGATHSEADGGKLGSYIYDQSTDSFWLATFGSAAGVRKYDADAGTSETYVSPTDIELFNRASDVAGGVTSPNHSGFAYFFSMLLNPKAITVGGVTYQPGEFAVLTNYSEVKEDGLTVQPNWGKALVSYDLRKIGSPTTAQPDRDNAQNGLPGGAIGGAFGVTDWNDALGVLATNQDFADASVDSDYSGRPYIARQASWSSDGKSLYMTQHSTRAKGGGIYKLNVETGALTHVVQLAADASNTYYGESSVIHTNVRDFGAGEGVGDQVLVNGAAGNGNAGGISYFVDGAGGVSDLKVLLSGADFEAFTETSNGSASQSSKRFYSSTVDDEGNLYFTDGRTGSIFMYDKHDRLVSVANKAQLAAFNQFVDAGKYSNSGNSLRLQNRVLQDGSVQVMARTDNKNVAGIRIGKIGDFNGDDVITAADTQFFINQFNVADATALAAGGSDYLNYISADLNGNSGIASSTTGALSGNSVTTKDLDVLRTFVNLKEGDANWDFTVNIADFEVLRANFDPTATDKSFFDGNNDYNTDGNVDIADFEALRANFNPAETYEAEVTFTQGTAVSLQANAITVPTGELALEVLADGTVNLVGNQASLTSFQIVGAADSIVETNFIALVGMFEQKGDAFVGGLGFAPVAVDGAISLGQIYNAGLDLQDLAFTYNGSVVGAVTYAVPEPSVAMLLGAMGLGFMRRRR
ncbi:PEP-CTERM sorting domain-containing protein [Poriferisphaera sp. WC338]|uniref:PEP-CTERM sorting domain-containing protein n=1 Tax=Poriferisphaera sp. WC338 TaxID=3425129 RepID=UPI003D81BE1F